MSAGTLNAFVRTLQLSEGGLSSSPSSTTPRPPTRFRFETSRPSSPERNPPSRFFIPQVSVNFFGVLLFFIFLVFYSISSFSFPIFTVRKACLLDSLFLWLALISLASCFSPHFSSFSSASSFSFPILTVRKTHLLNFLFSSL